MTILVNDVAINRYNLIAVFVIEISFYFRSFGSEIDYNSTRMLKQAHVIEKLGPHIVV